MKRRAFWVIVFVACVTVISLLTSCSTDNRQADGARGHAKGSYSSVDEKAVRLVEMTSIGEVPYEYFSAGSSIAGYEMFDSYGLGDYADYFDTELFPFYYNSKFGFADPEGNVVISERYERVNFFSENKAFVKNNGLWQVIDIQGKELLTVPNGYSCSETFFQNGTAIIPEIVNMGSNKLKLSVLVISENMDIYEFEKDTGKQAKARVINTPDFSGVLTYHLSSYADNSAANGYRYEHVYTLHDITGTEVWNVIIPTEVLDVIFPYNSGIADKLFSSLGSGYYFHHEGITALDAFWVKEGYMNVVNADGKWGLLKLKSDVLSIPYSYDFVGAYSDGCVAVCSYGKWGYVDINGNVIISPTFQYAGGFVNGRAFAITADNQHVIIDKSGTVMTTLNIDWDDKMNQVFPFSNETGISIIVRGDQEASHYGSFTVITTTGEILLQKENCTGIYISNNYIFLDGKMYKIEV